MTPAHKSKTVRDADLPSQGRAVTPPTAGRVQMLVGAGRQPSTAMAVVEMLLSEHECRVGSRMKGKESWTSLTLITGQLQHRHPEEQLNPTASTHPNPQPHGI